jgi:hypothetical protein
MKGRLCSPGRRENTGEDSTYLRFIKAARPEYSGGRLFLIENALYCRISELEVSKTSHFLPKKDLPSPITLLTDFLPDNYR